MTQKQLSVAVGIIRNAEQQYFIARRPDGVHMAGMWEFPGGKVEEGETPEQALIRELHEETGIEASAPQALNDKTFSTPERIITLHFFLVETWQGEPYGREGQESRWVNVDELREEEFPPANAEMIRWLKSL
ncbi:MULTISPECIES: 8-oxo-dGTP diphosphatase MutT [Pectobacterium]|jgi:8-oxo-dGTP diphosphatase|uniref:8-oxo-dGTP diphosphatase n=1 Tax=Pectobacterium versatile TaxID=2488639 RepID=A0A855MJI6_9GAMM|nr:MULTISPECIES: 8-oxo-dGTP diphosphatase MutT [Pectobacterium]MDQ5892185.1 8-oxo-dGTP diphosphatase [Pseudomonadota bacterium]KFX01646.1 nucleoside triphosphate hydrolase [Pectobacterium carotovorum subsp. carotovorum]KHT24109.1 nucleoside triphosphate hydrolase [Pectobacterium carotovorum subsp. carotovorum]KML66826.1 nucleoside triphosphate hydrolase [Pectobacterium carotovorum subsp. carotovorum ICMP 5702]MBA0160121.1 8-oxo-dGTP diphosphatase MutT [Pectobacterium versatile]